MFATLESLNNILRAVIESTFEVEKILEEAKKKEKISIQTKEVTTRQLYDDPNWRITRIETALKKVWEIYEDILKISSKAAEIIKKIKDDYEELQKLLKEKHEKFEEMGIMALKIGEIVSKEIEALKSQGKTLFEAIGEIENTFVLLSEAIKERLAVLTNLSDELGLDIKKSAVGVSVELGAKKGTLSAGAIEELEEKILEIEGLTEKQKEEIVKIFDEITESAALITATVKIIGIDFSSVENLQEVVKSYAGSLRDFYEKIGQKIPVKAKKVSEKSAKYEKLKEDIQNENDTVREEKRHDKYYIIDVNGVRECEYDEFVIEAIEDKLDILLAESVFANIVTDTKSAVKYFKSIVNTLKSKLHAIYEHLVNLVLSIGKLIGLRKRVEKIKKIDVQIGDLFIDLAKLVAK